MSNDSFDMTNIKYANSHSKITVKSKQKLDELAAQVVIWNQEDLMKVPSTPNNNEKTRHPLGGSSGNRRSTIFQTKGMVKEKRAYFESLTTPTNDKKELFLTPKLKPILQFPFKIDFNEEVIPESMLDKENNDPYIEDILPPPPDDDLLEAANTEAILNQDNQLMSVEESICKSDISEEKLSADLTRISSLTSSTFSLYDEIVSELAKQEINADIQSLPDHMYPDEVPKTTRRSLSFNDKVEYIYPSSADESLTNSMDADILISEVSQSVSNQSKSFVSVTETTDGLEYSATDLQERLEAVKADGKELLETLKILLSDKRFQLGGGRHTEICVNIMKNILLNKSLTERIHKGPSPPGIIIGTLNLKNIDLSIKSGFELIDYKDLMRRGLSDKLDRLSMIFHVILMVRCVANTSITASSIYTIVSGAETRKLGLCSQPLTWLEMFHFINFHNLQPGFRLMFELHCMTVYPEKFQTRNKNTPKSKTPMKKIFCNSPSDQDRSSFFTNIGSFELSAKGLISNSESMKKEIHIPHCYPFNGHVKFNGSLNLHLGEKFCGRLNVYMDISGVGSWCYRDCEVTHTYIIGGRKSEDSDEIDEVDIKIPFFACQGSAALCDYKVCAKANSFSILIRESKMFDKIPINRRLSTDGKKKHRFLAAAESHEDAVKWCKFINEAKGSFLQWANDADMS